MNDNDIERAIQDKGLTAPRVTPETPRYKGWFGLCPVWVRLDGEGVELDARYPFTGWLFWLSEKVVGAAIFFSSMLNPEWEPQWPIRITDPNYPPDRG